ncbi:MAG: Coenzyme F420 hydrogenase/dehydrogenase, beta subunit C-terminal domain [Candidatus Bathyarchaeota archaeon]|nr:Coenzyme F420 hydrogenase/dehydrogenase, beta subunit C-terminal domain [Candidatus Bathyarchaeota archaeon]
MEFCPGINLDVVDAIGKKNTVSAMMGNCLGCYTAYSNNPDVRLNSTSGGLVTTLIVELLKNKEFDAAFVLDFDKFEGKPARLTVATDVAEVMRCAKSKYVPASVYNVIKVLKRREDKKYVIVGTSCQIWGITHFIQKFGINKENLFLIGLFCDKNLNFNFLRFVEDTYKTGDEQIVKFEYRTKEKSGWPGHTKMVFDSGRQKIIHRNVRINLQDFFQLNRCRFCINKLNKYADISVGDCYIKGKDDYCGKSSVIIRTEKGKSIFERYSKFFTVEKSSMASVEKSQVIQEKTKNITNIQFLIAKYGEDLKTPEVKNIFFGTPKEIMWGMTYNVVKIKSAIFLSNVSQNLFKAKKILELGVGFASIVGTDVLTRGSRLKNHSGQNVIIVGADLFNKGAQAMTFTVVDQVKQRYPDKKIIMLSASDYDRDELEKMRYSFRILPWDIETRLWFSAFNGKLFVNKSKHKLLHSLLNSVVDDSCCFIDISGFALSSQWGLLRNISYLLNIAAAKKHSVPYYIFPQSIGPFSYPLKFKFMLTPLLSTYLKYPQKIFAREQEGLRYARIFSKNAEKGYDIVLQNSCDPLRVYSGHVQLKLIHVDPDSVGIIPNLRVIEHANSKEIYLLYFQMIATLLSAKKTVYLLRHSSEDLEVTNKIKSHFSDDKNVQVIVDDLNSFELEYVIKQFDFIIASRYHAIIHAYKNGVPALVLGWAIKYEELMQRFNQMDFFFDVRKTVHSEKINEKLQQMLSTCNFETKKISCTTANIQKEQSVFSHVQNIMQPTKKGVL